MFHPDHELISPTGAPSGGWASLLLHWTFDPLVLLGLLAASASYALGTRRLWQHASRYHGVSRAQVLFFAAGWLTVLLALLSPLDWLSDFLFAAHMTQHELLMLVAAPLWVAGRPLVPAIWLLSSSGGASLPNGSKAWWRGSFNG